MSAHKVKMILAAKAELARRQRMIEQKEEAEQDLLSFIHAFWHVVEPTTTMIDGWVLDAMVDVLMAVEAGHIKRLLVNVSPGSMKSLLLNVFFPAWIWGPRGRPSTRFICASYNEALPERDNSRFLRVISNPVYRQLWCKDWTLVKESVGHIENSLTGSKRTTSTHSGTTGHRADFVLIDDANDPNNVESDSVRQATTHWLREVMPDRLNNLDEGAIISIQQRTHEMDATGVLAKHGKGYDWLCIPMEFDPFRIGRCVLERDENGQPTRIWVDPRSLDKDGNQLKGLDVDAKGKPFLRPGSPMAKAQGELAWPERFSSEAIHEQKVTKGPYAYCNPYDAPILMADLSLKPIGEIVVGDKIVGWTSDVSPKNDGEKFGRRQTIETEVLSISVSQRPTVRITLDSGHIIRCTLDHKWYTGRSPQDPTHPMYAPARVGRALMRICPPYLPDLVSKEDLRLAGWLGGFFDGEGSVTFQQRRTGASLTSLITFSQTEERNLPLCEKLEAVLKRFNIPFGVKSLERRNPWQTCRWYWLMRNGIETNQRFLHIARPSKWVDRIIQGAYSTRILIGEEKVVSIEPDKEKETVYGLETTTGNYVVWGLASANSSQYDQFPGVRGGGIIQKDWWMPWDRAEYPTLGTVIVTLDTAIEQKESNDWNACTVWGAFEGDAGQPQFLLLDAWRIRAPLAQLVARVSETCRARKADYLIIEHKTRGRDVHDEIARIYQGAPWQTELFKVEGDKESRLRGVSHLFSGDVKKDPVSGIDVWTGGLVYAPDRLWADEVIDEVSSFPYGEHDDYVDCVSMALSWVRRNGVVLRRAEYDEAEIERKRYKKPMSTPYAIKR